MQEERKRLLWELLTTIIWSVSLFSIVLYEVELLNRYDFWFIDNWIYAPAYFALMIFTPLFVSGYLKRRMDSFFDRWWRDYGD